MNIYKFFKLESVENVLKNSKIFNLNKNIFKSNSLFEQ
jgi:hypothetical protein